MIDGFEKFTVPDEIKALREQMLIKIDRIANERGIEPDLPSAKIKELVRRYTWKERYNRLKVHVLKVRAGEMLTEEELHEIDFLFKEEENNLRRQLFVDKEIELQEKATLLNRLRDIDIFILSHGAIESYYPDGVVGDDKPTKALNAVAILKDHEDCRAYLPIIKVGDEDICELEVIFKKIFE